MAGVAGGWTVGGGQRDRWSGSPTSNGCSLGPIMSCRLALSSGPTACLYCHLSGTKGHFMSLASWIRVLSSLGREAGKVRVQVRKWLSEERLGAPHVVM